MDAVRVRLLGKLVGALVAAGVLTAGLLMPVVLGGGILARNQADRFLNTACDLQESTPPQKTTFYARDGKTLIATIFTQNRQPVPLSRIPTYLQDALVATEDRRFYSHHGVDLRGLIRSVFSTSSGNTQGGSTLTMQYVKQIRYFQASEITDPAKQQAAQDAAIAQTAERKMEDVKCALYFENVKKESKAQILDNYLNIAFFGENSYSIQTAAQTYFNKDVSKLTLAESALLVGLLRAPSDYDPFLYPVAAKQRRDEVLQNLVDVGKLSQAQADQQKATPIVLASKTAPVVQQGCANSSSTIPNAGFFCDYVQRWLANVNGISQAQQSTGGYKVVTTLDPSVQSSTQAHMNDKVSAKAGSTAVLPILDPHTGDVLAMAASKTYGGAAGQTFQPIFTEQATSGASTFKLFPLLVALSTGIPATQQLSTVGNSGTYSATSCATAGSSQNGDADENYNTVESLQSATAKSGNTYFVALGQKLFGCQLQPVVDLMRKLGMTGIDAKSTVPGDAGQTWAKIVVDGQRVQQLLLGQAIPASALELAGAYAAVADNGVYNAPAPVLSITDSAGNDVPVKRTRGQQVLAPQVAAQAVQILTGDTTGDGTSASAFGSWYSAHPSQVAGKTGTADLTAPYEGKNGAVWFVGLTPNLVGAAGLVNFDSPSTPNNGISGLAPGAAYGADVAGVWLDALEPTLATQSWSWPDPAAATGVAVPNLQGQSPEEAKTTLSELGLSLTILGQQDNLMCAASADLGTIGFSGPSVAPAGSTVTACLSTQVPAYSAPIVRQTPRTGTPAGTTQGTQPGTRPSGGATPGPRPSR